jgi:hypothetical protein
VQLAGDPARRAALGRSARDRAEAEFSATLMADRYLDSIAAIDRPGPWRSASSRRQ